MQPLPPDINNLIQTWGDINPEKTGNAKKNEKNTLEFKTNKFKHILIKQENNTFTCQNKDLARKKLKDRINLSKKNVKKTYSFTEFGKDIQNKFKLLRGTKDSIKTDDLTKIKNFVTDYNKMVHYIVEKKESKKLGWLLKIFQPKKFKERLRNSTTEIVKKYLLPTDWEQTSTTVKTTENIPLSTEHTKNQQPTELLDSTSSNPESKSDLFIKSESDSPLESKPNDFVEELKKFFTTKKFQQFAKDTTNTVTNSSEQVKIMHETLDMFFAGVDTLRNKFEELRKPAPSLVKLLDEQFTNAEKSKELKKSITETSSKQDMEKFWAILDIRDMCNTLLCDDKIFNIMKNERYIMHLLHSMKPVFSHQNNKVPENIRNQFNEIRDLIRPIPELSLDNYKDFVKKECPKIQLIILSLYQYKRGIQENGKNWIMEKINNILGEKNRIPSDLGDFAKDLLTLIQKNNNKDLINFFSSILDNKSDFFPVFQLIFENVSANNKSVAEILKEELAKKLTNENPSDEVEL